MGIINDINYESPVVKIVDIKVHEIICTSPYSQTENTTEEDLFQ